MPFLLAEILNFQGSTHRIGVGSFSKIDTGNYTLRYKGEYITIMKSKFGVGWGVIFRGERCWEYRGEKIRDLDTAKLAAFELFDEIHG